MSEGDARAFVVRSLAVKAQSVEEIRAKLAARGVAPADAETVVDEAVRLGYLDDAELAGQLAHGFRARGYGRRRAALAMRRRGLPVPEAEDALEATYGEADEAALARAALGSRRLDDDSARRRAAAFLVRRGFSSTAAWGAVRTAGDS